MNQDLSKRIAKLEDRVQELESLVMSENAIKKTEHSRTKQLSAKEFLLLKRMRSAAEKTFALAYYLEYIVGVKSFNIDDLEVAFRSAKEKPPVNINDMVNKNIAKGYLMEVEEKKDKKKAWILTGTGEKVAEKNFLAKK